MALLTDARNVAGENALALLLRAVRDQVDPETACYGELGSLAEALEGVDADVGPGTDDRSDQKFADLEIRVLPRQDETYPVDLTLDGEHVWRGRMSSGIGAWVSRGDPEEDGRRLFRLLFADPELLTGWTEAQGLARERRIRLWLDVDEPVLHTLPWELMHDGTSWLSAAARTPFSRYLPGRGHWGAALLEPPLRVLVVLANPADLARYGLVRLDASAEYTALKEALLGELGMTSRVHLEFLSSPVTLSKLEASLRVQPYHILHYLGHGAFSALRDQAILYMEDAEGATHLTRDAALAGMLERLHTPPLLVFLAACQSAARSSRATFAGLAPQLVRAGIPAVVAMQDEVSLVSANALSAVFYSQLLRHGWVDRALNEARSTLLTSGYSDAVAPVLLMRLRDGRLLDLNRSH